MSVAYTGSVGEMFAKMVGSDGADYDLISIDTSIIERYLDQALIIPFDMSKIPNPENLPPSFSAVKEVMSGGETGPTMTDKDGYGNTTDESPGLDYADKLVWLRPVEGFDRRVKVWNEVKAAQ